MPRGSSSGGGTASSNVVLPADAQFWTDFDDARVCDFDQRCAAQQGALFSSPAVCREVLRLVRSLDYLTRGTSDVEDRASQLTGGDMANRQACLNHLATAPCNAPLVLRGTPCDAVFAPRVAAGTGTPCGRARACDVGLTCLTQNGCATCGTPLEVDAPCRGHQDCASEYCRALDAGSVCRPITERGGVGAPCENDTCLGGLACAQLDGGRACVVRAGAGQPCGVTGACTEDQACGSTGDGGPMVCTSILVPSGTACSRHSYNSPLCQCVFAATTDETGTCQTLTGPVGQGAPCVTSLFPDFGLCSPGTFGQNILADGGTMPVGCVCTAAHADCTACVQDSQCQPGFICWYGSGTGRCEPPHAGGERCLGDRDCASAVCDRDGGVCAAPVMCP